ncbi:hypothetical protein R6Q59_014533 [Mikania micrantha]
MLLSPSHSPRRLSSLSPSVSESPAHQTPGSSNSLITPTSTNPRKRNPSTLLDEDTYVAAIEKIIQRDFFPDVPKLRDRLDWLEATRTGDSGVESTRTRLVRDGPENSGCLGQVIIGGGSGASFGGGGAAAASAPGVGAAAAEAPVADEEKEEKEEKKLGFKALIP